MQGKIEFTGEYQYSFTLCIDILYKTYVVLIYIGLTLRPK